MSVKVRLNRRREEVIEKLANIVKEAKKDENVEGVLLNKYKGEEPSCVTGNVFDITILTHDGKLDDTTYNELDKNTQDPKFNIVINNRQYKDFLNAETWIFNSSVLYDKKGEYTSLKDRMNRKTEASDDDKKHLWIRYGNSMDIIPPIEDELKLKLEEKVEE